MEPRARASSLLLCLMLSLFSGKCFASSCSGFLPLLLPRALPTAAAAAIAAVVLIVPRTLCYSCSASVVANASFVDFSARFPSILQEFEDGQVELEFWTCAIPATNTTNLSYEAEHGDLRSNEPPLSTIALPATVPCHCRKT